MNIKHLWPQVALCKIACCAAHLSAGHFFSGKESFAVANSQTTSSKSSTETFQSSKPPLFDPHSLSESCRVWIEGEGLFWQANEGSLDYGTESKSTATIKGGKVKQPHFDWDWGFRLGIGYKVPNDKWDLFLHYTYLQGEARGDSSAVAIFPVWASGFHFSGPGSFYATSAKAHWEMILNLLDLEWGRNCLAGKWLSFRPFIGIRSLFIDQNYHVSYRGGTVAPVDEDKVHLDTDFWGIGMRMGVNSLWGLGKGFGIYGNGSFSLLSGHFDVEEREKLKEADIRLLSVEKEVDNVVVAADLALGLQWDYLFSRNRYHFGIKFGWEFNLFFDQNQLFNFLSTSPSSIHFQNDDLTFQGITLGLRFDF